MPIDAFADLPTHAAALRRGEYSSVALTEFCLNRLETHGPTLNALVAVTRERALREAERADAELALGVDRGPLHGIPYGVKDLLAAAGYPTTWGAEPLRNQRFEQDSAAVAKLTAAGAVLCAKLAMAEWAGGFGYEQPDASFTGPAVCAWGEDRWAGGSSSGSGSAVGAGLLPFALGSETWGSIHSPANNNGVCGLRPTFGRVDRAGCMTLSWTMDKLGPLARTAHDCGLVLNAIAGGAPLNDDGEAGGAGEAFAPDEMVAERAYRYPPERVRTPPFKLAVLPGAAERAQDAVRENYEASLEALRSLGTVEEIELPAFPYEVAATVILNAELAAASDDFVSAGLSWDLTAPEDRYGGLAGRMIPAVDYLNALRVRAKFARALDRLFAPFDAIVTPARATVAQPLGMPFRRYAPGATAETLGGPANAAGLPGLCLPNGFDADGLPTGLNLVGRAFGENRVLAVGRAYQAVTDWHTRRPERWA
ncbi:amidase [Alienimonas californiensis]|uniref:Glutamyl-tRNA(Gln) amidotransferase subunit A n=1 Tax=Alienimonas californiensis TaxID=2527989 RepID=A0A517P8T2_9PLAN|nr:amidase [Alienimonas californiensis]QDT15772.1 Glutamyl-tRNA(Gln) amidotransferase subunit A [Alienimonas californiensis]